MSLKQEISVAKCERIMIYPYVRLDEDNKSFKEFAKECSEYWGGTLEDWAQRNKNLVGLFGSRKKGSREGQNSNSHNPWLTTPTIDFLKL